MNEQLNSLLSAMEILPDGILLVDRRQRIVACNRAAETMFGYLEGELVDEPLAILIPPALRDVHTRHLVNHDPTARVRPMSDRPILAGVNKAGKRLALSIGISTIGEEDQRLFVAVVRDAKAFDTRLNGAIQLAETDPLTQLGNRRFLTSKFDEYEKAEDNPVLAIAFLDLDHFKALNDEYGHDIGDEVLAIVARRLRASLRRDDSCVRLGGDEFVVIMSGIAEPGALERTALKLHASVTAPMRIHKLTLRVGASIGGALGIPARSGAQMLLDRADAAMYRAKIAGVPYCFDKLQQPAAA